jgi:hypothetical protein
VNTQRPSETQNSEQREDLQIVTETPILD